MSVDRNKSFAEFSDLCESILKAKRKDKVCLLADYILSWRSHPGYNATNPETSFFPCLQLLCPALDRSRPAFGLKEFSLVNQYLRILGINKKSKEGEMISYYKLPKHAKVQSDLSSIIMKILASKGRTQNSDLSIKDVNDCLTRIALSYQDGNQSGINSNLEHLILNLGPLENKWLIRIILKSLNFRLSETVILNTFHPDARSFYDCNQDLAEVCVKLADDRIRGFVVSLTVFKPFVPMLSERIEIKKINSITSGKPFCIEKKYDGERIVLHKQGDVFKYFSRNGFDFSESFNKSFTPFIDPCFNKISDCIIDGEMLGFNVSSNSLITKSQLKFDIKKLTDGDLEAFHPVYFVFDILVCNGQQLTSKPLKERSQILSEYLQTKENWLMHADKQDGNDKYDTIRCLNDAIDKRDEGIIVKFWDSIYKPNIRRNSGWFKLKPDYIEGLMDDLDLLIVGGYYGDGRRAGIISRFMLAVAVKEDDCIDGRRFRSFGKVGSGYSDSELKTLLEKLEPHWVKFNPSDPPSFLELGKAKPEFYVEPKNSFILQVKASEFMESDDFAVGTTLRFPRVVCIRYDKKYSDCMTTEELSQLQEQGNLFTRQIGDLSDDDDEPVKKRRKPVSDRKFASHFILANLDSVEMCKDILQGREMCVLNGSSELPKISAEKLIVQYGGKISANPTKECYCLIAHSVEDLRVKNLIKFGNYDILRLDWLMNVLEHQLFISPSYHDYIVMTSETRESLSRYFDQFGDSYFVDMSRDDLLRAVESIGYDYQIDNDDEDAEESENFYSEANISSLNGCEVFIDSMPSDSDNYPNIAFARASLTFGGAEISEEEENSTHQLILNDKNELILKNRQPSDLSYIFDSDQCQWHPITD
ncbi:DNA ligase 4-like [Tetranychus urticae]|uniref:DNA ligase 4 n=1 Tax=Tetranychus urticae TaxID=32264 RepID=T1KXJ6_TETUR|nr:DNA ligase 4-like [Tetranychus urticae]